MKQILSIAFCMIFLLAESTLFAAPNEGAQPGRPIAEKNDKPASLVTSISVESEGTDSLGA
ncbi:MAG: hypothetical protein J5803_04970, partial [Desulfovibrio sp.]|nr:hypothetical protein [Desulfovibrio sp.]